MFFQSLPKGTILQGRYKIIDVLGQGGMGTVYLAEDQHLFGRYRAIKEILTELVDNIDTFNLLCKQFQIEAQILSELDHPNLPKIHQYFFESHRPYLVMDYIEGKKLSSIISQAEDFLSEEQVIDWAVQICKVLNYLHNQKEPIIYRDLSPNNIIIDPQGNLKLIDFGIARKFSPTKSSDTLALGKDGYSPPEQYAGGGQTDVRSDIYSLGATLHETLTKVSPSVHPFNLPNPSEINPSVSEGLERIVLRCIELKPKDRFQSAKEVLEALRGLSNPPFLSIEPTIINFQNVKAGDMKKVEIFVKNTGGSELKGKVIPEHGWVKVEPSVFRANSQKIEVEISTIGFLGNRIYNSGVTIDSNGGFVTIPISIFTIDPPMLKVSSNYLNFGILSSDERRSLVITVSNKGQGLLEGKISNEKCPWVEADPLAFKGTTKVKVTVDAKKLTEGVSQSGALEIKSTGGMTYVTVVAERLGEAVPEQPMVVTQTKSSTGKAVEKKIEVEKASVPFAPVYRESLPLLEVVPASLNFGVIYTQSPITKTFEIVNKQHGSLSGTIEYQDLQEGRFPPWLSVEPMVFYANNQKFQVLIKPQMMQAGENKINLLVKSNAVNNEVTVPITAQIPKPTIEEWPMFRLNAARLAGGLEKKRCFLDKMKWKYTTGAKIISSPAFVDEVIYIGSEDYYVYAIEAVNSKIRWQVKTNKRVSSSPSVSKKTVFVGSDDLYALSIYSGQEKWRYKIGSWVRSSPCVADGVVYFGADDYCLHALDETNGKSFWVYETEYLINSSPVVFNDLVLVGSNDACLHAIGRKTGKLVWRYETDEAIYSSPAVSGKDDLVCIGSDDTYLYSLDLNTGKLNHKFKTGGPIQGTPAILDGVAYVGSMDGCVYAFDLEVNTELWRVQTGRGINSSPTIANTILYIGSNDRYLYAISTETGDIKGRFKTGGGIESSPICVEGVVYFGSNDGNVYAVC